MYTQLDEQSLSEAYEGRSDLQGAIRNAAAAGPQYVELFNCISEYILSLAPTHSSDPNLSKKRKLEESKPLNTTLNRSTELQPKPKDVNENENVLLEVEGISFMLPQRKKFTLCFTDHYLYARLLREQVGGTKVLWKDIEYVFLLPIPEKTQAQHGFIIFPYNSCCHLSQKSLTGAAAGPIVFAVFSNNAPNLKTISGSLLHKISAVSDDWLTLISWVLKSCLKTAGNSIEIISPDEKLFCSALRQFHRPKEKAVWVKAFRGSTEGYLFFLTCGILWAFRKPILFLSHSKISSVSFTSVLSRTFNLNVEILIGDEASESNEIEFTMLEQEDFENIKRYINRYGLQDRSMANQRKAKMLNTKNEEGYVLDQHESELVKAGLNEEISPENQEILDDDDSEGEDYDPGSQGQSEGSGSSSEEDMNTEEDDEADIEDGANVNESN